MVGSPIQKIVVFGWLGRFGWGIPPVFIFIIGVRQTERALRSCRLVFLDYSLGFLFLIVAVIRCFLALSHDFLVGDFPRYAFRVILRFELQQLNISGPLISLDPPTY